jgi:hypothetical protein
LCSWWVLGKARQILGCGGNFSGIPEYVANHFSLNRLVAIQICLFVLFLIQTGGELKSLFGNGELVKILFTGRSVDVMENGVSETAMATVTN